MSQATADLYSQEVDLEKLTVDELVQRLEAMEKNNEQIKRENQLFESYLLRKSKEDRRTDDDAAARYKAMRQRAGDKPLKMTPEHKYEIASQELETLKANIEEGRDKSETLLERLKAILEGTDLSIAEIRKEAFDFGRFLSAAENGRIGKYDAEKLSKYSFDKLKQKENLIDKLQSKNVSLKVHILKAENQIKHKDEMGDDLKFIDFHQLQIENKQHVKNIDDKNKKLIQYKLNSGITVGALQKLKNAYEKEKGEATQIEQDIEKNKASFQKKKADIGNTQEIINQAVKSNREQQQYKAVNQDQPDPLQFVTEKNKHMELNKKVKNMERKIEIAELEARKAKAILKKRDRQKMMQGYEFDQ